MAEIKPYEVYTPSETQELLKVSSSTFKRLIKKGLIKANKVGGQYRILGHELLQLVSPRVDERASALYKRVKEKTVQKVKDW